MRLIISSVATCAIIVCGNVSAFTPRSSRPFLRSTPLLVGSSAEEILARNREQVSQMGAAAAAGPREAPILFDKDLLDDVQQSLLTLERVIQEGPGALTLLEVEELDAGLARIKDEMRRNEQRVRTTTSLPPQGAMDAQVVSPSGTAAFQATRPSTSSSKVMDTSLDEGPMYDGRGGMGQAKGTVNTYIIPGMDEMTSDEYRLALQQSLIDRQSSRKEGTTYGNRSSWGYLNALSGETGILKTDSDDGTKSPKQNYTPVRKTISGGYLNAISGEDSVSDEKE